MSAETVGGQPGENEDVVASGEHFPAQDDGQSASGPAPSLSEGSADANPDATHTDTRSTLPRRGPGHLDEQHHSRMLALMVLYEVDFSDHPAAEVLARTLSQPDDDTFVRSLADEVDDDDAAGFPIDGDERSADISAWPESESASPRDGSDDNGEGLVGDDAWEQSAERVTTLVHGTLGRLAEIDLLVSAAAPAFPLRQIAGVDRNILRLATFELLETPANGAATPAVVVNDAVELAKRFGGERSGKFVNGALRTIAERLGSQRRSIQATRPAPRRQI